MASDDCPSFRRRRRVSGDRKSSGTLRLLRSFGIHLLRRDTRRDVNVWLEALRILAGLWIGVLAVVLSVLVSINTWAPSAIAVINTLFRVP